MKDRELILAIIAGAMHRLCKVSSRKSRVFVLVSRIGESDFVRETLEPLTTASTADVFRKRVKQIKEKLKCV